MSLDMTWAAALATIAVLLIYETVQGVARRRNPLAMARTAHADLREQWFAAISRQPGSEILAVQTLRNSLMSATMIASTAALGLMGTATLAAPSLHDTFGAAADVSLQLTPRMTLELVLMGLLFASLASSVMAVRYYNHASFISAIPVGSPERQHWSGTGTAYVRRAGVLYSWGLRHLILIAPILVCMFHAVAGPIAAIVVTVMLSVFDRMDTRKQ